MIGQLKERWQKAWQTLQADSLPQAVFDELIRVYSSPERFYHNLGHIEDCLSRLDRAISLAAQPEQVELAIWFHDAVYDTRRGDNEQKSAEWARKVILHSGLPDEIAQRVAGLILATRHDAEVQDADAQLIVDIDLAILGADPDVFWRYEENIRKEYAWVPESLFRQKRIAILHGFLSRPSIYHHLPYRERFEEKARFNLQQAIVKLSDSSGVANN